MGPIEYRKLYAVSEAYKIYSNFLFSGFSLADVNPDNRTSVVIPSVYCIVTNSMLTIHKFIASSF